MRAFILRAALASLCQVNLFNAAAKYNKSHIPSVPEGSAIIITAVALLDFGFSELKMCEASRDWSTAQDVMNRLRTRRAVRQVGGRKGQENENKGVSAGEILLRL